MEIADEWLAACSRVRRMKRNGRNFKDPRFGRFVAEIGAPMGVAATLYSVRYHLVPGFSRRGYFSS